MRDKIGKEREADRLKHWPDKDYSELTRETNKGR